MKKIISFSLFFVFILIGLVSAIYGGDSYTKTFNECDNITVTIQATENISDNEFTLNDECIMVDNYTYTYNCDCYDGWIFNLTTKINTINDYNITFNYNYEEIVTPNNGGSSSGSGGSSRRKDIILNETFCNSSNWNCSEWIEVNGNQFRNCYNDCGSYLLDKLSKPITYEVAEDIGSIEDVEQIVEEIKQIEEPEGNNHILLIVIISVLILGGVIWFVIWKFI